MRSTTDATEEIDAKNAETRANSVCNDLLCGGLSVGEIMDLRASSEYADHAIREWAYYKCACLQSGRGPWPKPPFVPARVLVTCRVRGDGPFASTTASAGEYECQSNQYGAVSIEADNGQMLGLRLNEFRVLAWRVNGVA